jgi:hypothetical protein
MNKNNYLPWLVAAGFVASLAIALPVFAQTASLTGGAGVQVGLSGHYGMRGGGGGMPPGVFGTVSAVSGTTLTVTAMTRPSPNASSTPGAVYTVDASNAQVFKNGTSSAVTDIATGDKVMVQGTVSGTNVTATVIRDGFGGMMGGRGMPGGQGGNGFGHGATSTLPIQGNGEPVIAGSITAISGTTITVTNASNVTYTIDASNATIVKGGASSTIANVAVGDNLIVQGTVNGTSVTASSVIDQGSGSKGTGTSTVSAGAHASVRVGFFGAIGSFFKHLFGF